MSGYDMGYTLTAITDTKERAERIEYSLNKIVKLPEFEDIYLFISSEPNEHGYAPDVSPCICISYSTLPSPVHKFCWNVVFETGRILNTASYYDSEKMDFDQNISWEYKQNPDDSFFMNMLNKFNNKYRNKEMEKLKKLYDKYLEPVITG